MNYQSNVVCLCYLKHLNVIMSLLCLLEIITILGHIQNIVIVSLYMKLCILNFKCNRRIMVNNYNYFHCHKTEPITERGQSYNIMDKGEGS